MSSIERFPYLVFVLSCLALLIWSLICFKLIILFDHLHLHTRGWLSTWAIYLWTVIYLLGLIEEVKFHFWISYVAKCYHLLFVFFFLWGIFYLRLQDQLCKVGRRLCSLKSQIKYIHDFLSLQLVVRIHVSFQIVSFHFK